jgi:hypothetical protein
MGHHAAADIIFCEVCMEEGHHVRLNRWPSTESGSLTEGRG